MSTRKALPCSPDPRLTGKWVILTIHGLDWARDKWKGSFGSWYIRMGEKTGARCAHEIIVLNHSTQKYFLDTYGRTTHYIPNGVNPAAPVPADIIREKYGLEKDSYILYLGRMVPEKGCHYLVDAFKKLDTDKAGHRGRLLRHPLVHGRAEGAGRRRRTGHLHRLRRRSAAGRALQQRLPLRPAQRP